MPRLSHTAYWMPALLFGTVYASFSAGQTLLQNQGPKKNDLDVKVRVSATWTDNRDQIDDGEIVAGKPAEKESSTIFSVGPVITYEHNVDQRLKFSVGYSPRYEYETDPAPGDDDWNWAHNADLDLLYYFNPRTSFSMRDRFSWSGASAYYYGTDYEYDPDREEDLNEDYYENTFSASVQRLLNERDYITLTGRWRIKRYDEDKYADYRDEDEYGVRLDWMHKAGRHLGYGLFADFTSWDRNSDAYDFGYTDLDVGVQYTVIGVQGTYDFTGDQNHLIYASVGWNHATYDGDQDDQDSFGDTRVELRLFQRDPVRLLAGLRYGLDYSDVFPFSSQEDLATYANVRYVFGSDQQFGLSAAIEYRLRQYNLRDDLDADAEQYGYYNALRESNGGSEDYDRTSIFVRLAAEWQINEWFTTSAFYTYESVECDVGSDFDENRVGVSATVRFY